MKNFLRSQIMTILLSWFMLFLFLFFQGEVLSKAYKVFVAFYFWMPGLVALYFKKKEKLHIPIYKKRHPKFFLAFSFAISLILLTAFFSIPFCEFRPVESIKVLLPSFLHAFSPEIMYALFILLWIFMGLILVPMIYLFVFLGQELMFSGYAWEKLKFLGFWKASWIIGLYRGLWMTPLVFLGMGFPGESFFSVFWMPLLFILMAPIKIYLRIVSKTILAPALFLGLFVHYYMIFFYLFKADEYFFMGLHKFGGCMGLVFINLILFLKTRKTPLLEYEL